GKDFPWLTADNIGDLLVLIPPNEHTFTAHVLDLEEDIEDIQATLGIEISGSWAIYEADHMEKEIDEGECIDLRFRDFAGLLKEFPSTEEFSSETQRVLNECIKAFPSVESDKKIVDLVDAEYKLFRLVERRLCADQITRLFKSVDDFLKTAATIMNRRKARAGRALENHVEYVLKEAQIPFDIRPQIDGKPDIVIPGKDAYEDSQYPTEKLFMVGVKTTCKDRWRQVLNEAKRIPHKHLLTLQPGISEAQLTEMSEASLRLIVPKPLHKKYPPQETMSILTVDAFVEDVRKALGS
ncbi:MAG: type II restriction endonuclease, partial [Candidatus Bathyarchaeia archaeon]